MEHGADPNVVDPRSGNTPLGEIHDDVGMVRAFVDNGADIDRIQSDGTPAVVRFIGTRQWDSALYLTEKGAKLDIVNVNGLSVDYYLNEWKESVFGEHPEGGTGFARRSLRAARPPGSYDLSDGGERHDVRLAARAFAMHSGRNGTVATRD